MEQIILSLLSDTRPLQIELHEKPPKEVTWEVDPESYQKVFPDKVYRFSLQKIDLDSIESVRVYINDEEETVSRAGHIFSFTSAHVSNYCVFKNKFGFVEMSIVIEYWDGHITTLYSDFLSIMIRKDSDATAIDLMIDYVYTKQESLMANGNVGSKTKGDIKKNHFINLKTRISLAEDILKVYKDSVGYFGANSKFKTKTIDTIDAAEKLQSVTPRTLQFIASNPGYLTESSHSTAIIINKKSYVPRRTLVQKNIYTYDIYENRVVVGFTKRMLNDIEIMIAEIEQILSKHEVLSVTENDYIHSAYFIFHRTENALKESLKKLRILRREYADLNNLYNNILSVKEEVITQIPRPSSIFLSIAQYNRIYNQINRWFNYGVYNLEQERFMMSFMNVSALYEIYVLAKMIDAFNYHGYQLVNRYRHQYRVGGRAMYTNTLCDNTFVFRRGTEETTLYYQPVIYNSESRAANGINLYRNNSIGTSGQGSYYYSPDYLIKRTNSTSESYEIVDAKLSDKAHIIRMAKDMSFKYLISLSPRSTAIMEGLYLVYGQVNKEITNESIYDKQQAERPITPSFSMIPIAAGVNEERHLGNLSELFY